MINDSQLKDASLCAVTCPNCGAATPEQSLARHDNRIKEECAILLESMCESDWSPKQLAKAIRATKGQE